MAHFRREDLSENWTQNKSDGKTGPMTRSAVVQHLADATKLSKRRVSEVFEALTALIKQQLGKKGPGVFTIPGLVKMKLVRKQGTPARQGIHPVTKQETTFKAKPARNVVRARALRSLNDSLDKTQLFSKAVQGSQSVVGEESQSVQVPTSKVSIADFAAYWRDYLDESGLHGNPVIGWKASRPWVNRLHCGDRVWLFIGGDACGDDKGPHQAYVAQLLVVDSWEEDPDYEPGVPGRWRFHIFGIEDRCFLVQPPILVDSIFRRAGTDLKQHIGIALQTPFRLDGGQVAKLLALLQTQCPKVYAAALDLGTDVDEEPEAVQTPEMTGQGIEPSEFPARLPKKVRRAIRVRRGQKEFREALLRAYEGRCAVTKYNARAALEAAHIRSYAETGSQDVTDGLLLRADIHTLFDLDLLRINPVTLRVELAPELRGTCYGELQGTQVNTPKQQADQPSREALRERWKEATAAT